MNTTVLTAVKRRAEKGFTLIELLVVIGILGVLAAALLATLDPLEQIRKGQDSNRQGVAVEFVQGMNRFYANKTKFPWELDTTDPLYCDASAAKDPNADTVKYVANNCIDQLIKTGELKTTFEQLPTIVTSGTNRVYWSYDNNGVVHACFQPSSKAMKATADHTQVGATGCTPTADNSNGCYVCFQ